MVFSEKKTENGTVEGHMILRSKYRSLLSLQIFNGLDIDRSIQCATRQGCCYVTGGGDPGLRKLSISSQSASPAHGWLPTLSTPSSHSNLALLTVMRTKDDESRADAGQISAHQDESNVSLSLRPSLRQLLFE